MGLFFFAAVLGSARALSPGGGASVAMRVDRIKDECAVLRDNGRDALFVPLADERGLGAALSRKSLTKAKVAKLGGALARRDNGLLDNVAWAAWGVSKKAVYDKLTTAAGVAKVSDESQLFSRWRKAEAMPQTRDRVYFSAYCVLAEIIDEVLCADLDEIWLERGCIADSRIVAGAFRMTRRRTGEQALVECTSDEALGLAVATNAEICVARDMLDAPSEDGGLTTCKSWLMRALPMAHELTASDFAIMTDEDKARAILAIDAVVRLPRPRAIREDQRLLDDVLLDRMDEAERLKVRVGLAMAAGTFDAAAKLLAGESQRSKLQRALAECERNGDLRAASLLRGELAAATERRADVTQDEGSYDRYLDKDEWYERGRRLSMGLDKPPKDGR